MSDPEAAGGRRRAPTIDLTATETPADTTSPDQAAGPSNDAAAPPRGGLPLALAGLAGGAAALALFGLLWLTGQFGATHDPRLAAIRDEVRAIAARPAPPTADPKTVDDLAQRLARAEAALAARPAVGPKALEDLAQRLAKAETALATATTTPAMAAEASESALLPRVAAVELALKALEATLSRVEKDAQSAGAAAQELRTTNTAIAQRLDDLARGAAERQRVSGAQAGDVERLATRIAALEQAIRDNAARERRASDTETVRAVRLALVANLLRSAVDRAAPFANELETARAFGADPKAVAALAPFAASGVPSAATLIAELESLLPAMRRAAAPLPPPPADPAPPPATASDSFIERLQSQAARLVRIRPLDETSARAGSGNFAPLQAQIARGDVPGAAAAVAALPPDVRAPAAAWMEKAAARKAAIEAAQAIAASALTALAKPAP